MVEDAGHRATNAIIEAFDRVGVNGATRILAITMAHRIVGGKGFSDRHERLSFIAQ